MSEQERPYLQSHPWLRFSINLQKFDYLLWMKLGEAQSKCDHIAGVPLLPSFASEMHQIYLAKGALATTAIEGNTLSESQVMAQLLGTLKLPPSKEYLGQEVQNILDACNSIATAIVEGTFDDSFDVGTIKRLNAMVLKDLALGEDVIAGEIRQHSVVVSNYRGAPASDCEYLLEKLCDFLNGFVIEGFPKAALGLVKAMIAHVYIAWIHPFGDGNGRTSRLMEFIILLQAGVSTPAAHLLSNHYNQTRSEYYRQLGRASQNGGDITDFVSYAVGGFVDGLKEQIDKIKDYQRDITWQKFVYENFQEKRIQPADRRRRDLVIELSGIPGPVPLHQIKLATPRIADAYAKISQATLMRDLNILKARGLIAMTQRAVWARKDRIDAFLPSKAEY